MRTRSFITFRPLITFVCLASLASLACAQQVPIAEPKATAIKTTEDDGDVNSAVQPTGPTLSLGDKAPKLYIEKWVKGDAVTSIEQGKVYVIEFWATWCQPCITSIPHLTKLQATYKDKGLTIIGISSDEENGLASVEPFVQKQGDKMNYVVGWDDAGRTAAAWMQAAQVRGIPHAFIIDREGRLAFTGHPMMMDDPLEQIVAGTWDLAQAKQSQENERALVRLQMRFAELEGEGKLNQAAEELTKGLQDRPALGAHLVGVIYSVHAISLDDIDTANDFAKRMQNELLKTDADALNALAWTIADAKEVAGRDLSLALSIAKQASDLKKQDAATTDTVAFVYAALREWPIAIATQEKAIEQAKDDETKDRYAETLARYKRQAK